MHMPSNQFSTISRIGSSRAYVMTQVRKYAPGRLGYMFEDIAHDSLLKALKYARNFVPHSDPKLCEAKFGRWLQLIVRSVVTDYVRKSVSHQYEDHVPIGERAGVTCVPDIMGSGFNPEELLLLNERKGKLQRACRGMDPRMVQAIIDHYALGISPNILFWETFSDDGFPTAGAFRSRLHREYLDLIVRLRDPTTRTRARRTLADMRHDMAARRCSPARPPT